MLLYFTLLDQAGSVGWIATLIFAICNCLRLARFNVQLDQPHKQPWQGQFFTGAPAPAGAMLVLAPVYIRLLGVEPSPPFGVLAALYAIGVGLLMVSRWPTWSGKDFGRRVPRAQVLPLLIAIVAFVGLLFSYPWGTLLTCIALYFAALPLSFRDYQRRAAKAAREAAPAEGSAAEKAAGDKSRSAKSA
jgi:CDP-diacylglycerol--serine O-phosphatidyltransferase